MTLLTAQQIKDWDAYTIAHEPISSLDLMERAAFKCVQEIALLIQRKPFLTSVVICCGPGNNGGDGLAIARLLANKGIHITVLLFLKDAKTTLDFEANRIQLPKEVNVTTVNSEQDIPEFTKQHLVIDALFGSGLNRAPEGLVAKGIDVMNKSAAYIVAIDIPSGLPAEVMSAAAIANRSIVKANMTLTFQLPKKSFMFAECYAYTGDVTVLEIGLHPAFLATVAARELYITKEMVQTMYTPRSVFSHKGTFGHALIAAGSYGKMGAAVLASKAALRTGCGLLTAFVPKAGYTIMQTALPEAMVVTDDEPNELKNFPDTTPYAAIGVGPGIGISEQTKLALLQCIGQVQQPVVIDADALNIIASVLHTPSSFRFPRNCIITPHPKEFDRLAGLSADSFERLQKQQQFAQQHHIIVVLKGAHTSIATPDGKTYFNSSGNPALATAGSGDVLTGIITSLLAQQYSLEEASVLGVYLHGICADNWIEQGKQTMIASDIVEMIPQAAHRIFN